MGLVKLVLESQTKRNVQRLTQTYLTLSLQDIADSVGLPSAAAAELVILRCAPLTSFYDTGSPCTHSGTHKWMHVLHPGLTRCLGLAHSVLLGMWLLQCIYCAWQGRQFDDRCLLGCTT